MSSPADLDIRTAGARLRHGRLTARELVQSHLTRIAERNDEIGAFVHIANDEAIAAAQRADDELAKGVDRGPLHGIPFAVKDLIDVAGWPVRHGSDRYAHRIAERTAPAVARLQACGAIPIGLAATYELATVGPDPTSLYPQPRNPWHRDHITGGSSSGSAAAVAAGMVRIALGSDTGGSIRSPAAFCGVCGLKPERGAIPTDGMQPLAPTLDTVGPIAANIAELALVYGALADRPAAFQHDIKRLRVGYARSWATGDAAGHPAVIELLDAAASTLSLNGAEIVLTDLPDYDLVEGIAIDVLRAEQTETHRSAIGDGGQGLGKMAFESIVWGHPLDACRSEAARNDMERLIAEFEEHLSGFDAIILPTTLKPAPPFSAFGHGKATWTPMRTMPFNLTGHAAMTVPMGFVGGLPVGLQIAASFGRTATILRVGSAFEAVTSHSLPRPYQACNRSSRN